MYKKGLFLIFSFLVISHISLAQKSISNNQFRLQQLKLQMDYRFMGGYYSFESLFLKSVKYTDEARQNCTVGIVIASFDVDCNGEIKNIKLRNPLGYKLDEQLTNFIKKTKGHWNKCDNNKYTHFDIPFMFTLEGTKTNTANAAFVYEGKDPGYACLSDDYYMQRIKKALQKKKGQRAKDYLDILIHRDPYNESYYKLMDQAIKYSGKDKKKSHKKDKK